MLSLEYRWLMNVIGTYCQSAPRCEQARRHHGKPVHFEISVVLLELHLKIYFANISASVDIWIYVSRLSCVADQTTVRTEFAFRAFRRKITYSYRFCCRRRCRRLRYQDISLTEGDIAIIFSLKYFCGPGDDSEN